MMDEKNIDKLGSRQSRSLSQSIKQPIKGVIEDLVEIDVSEKRNERGESVGSRALKKINHEI
jgi:hypothetical protein